MLPISVNVKRTPGSSSIFCASSSLTLPCTPRIKMLGSEIMVWLFSPGTAAKYEGRLAITSLVRNSSGRPKKKLAWPAIVIVSLRRAPGNC